MEFRPTFVISITVTIVLAIQCQNIYAANQRAQFEREGQHDDLDCQLQTSWTFDVQSRLQCSVQCRRQAGCYGFSLNSGGTCTGIGDLRLPPASSCTSSPGIRYYKIAGSFGGQCAVSEDCLPVDGHLVCTGGTCQCQDFYNWLPGRGVCVASCDVYGETFKGYDYIYTQGSNIKRYDGQTVFSCMQRCLDTDGCVSADFGPVDKQCYPSAVTLLQVPGLRGYMNPNALYLQRNCL